MNPYLMTPAERVAACGRLIDQIKQWMAPRTSEPWSRERSTRLRAMAQTVKVTGGTTRPGV